MKGLTAYRFTDFWRT